MIIDYRALQDSAEIDLAEHRNNSLHPNLAYWPFNRVSTTNIRPIHAVLAADCTYILGVCGVVVVHREDACRW
jgi:hypothetical protein